MLSRIEKITGLGLLHDVRADPNCAKVTLIYGENARGKSTLSALLRSVKTGDVSEVEERCTINGKLPLSAKLKFDRTIQVDLQNGAWSATRDELLIFDNEFVNRNVYSGIEVTTTHRKNLLDFALGDKAVVARQESLDRDEDFSKAKSAADAKALEIGAHLGGMTFAQFKALSKPDDLAKLKAELTQELANAQESSAILSATTPSELPIPVLEIDTYVASLSKTLVGVADDAERTVREHLAILPTEAESWLSEGQAFDDHIKCPYCAQQTEGLDLIGAYRDVFDEMYRALKSEVDLLTWSVTAALPFDMSEATAARIESLNETLRGWSTRCAITLLSFSKESFEAKLELVREELIALIERKRSDLGNYIVSPKNVAGLKSAWEEVKAVVRAQNSVMTSNIKTISKFKETLAAADPTAIQQKIEELDRREFRHCAAGKQLVLEVDATRAAASASRKAKDSARATLTAVMDKTLDDYKDGTNARLKELGARFQIGSLSGNHRSGGRSEFSIEMRGGEVKAEGGKPTFATALSESDKRTLAFAFFLASAIDPMTIANKTLVIDDPVSSFDAGRSKRTISALLRIQSDAEQLIVLSHDKFFLRSLKQKIDRVKPEVPMTVLGIEPSADQYSDLTRLDLELICESDYYSNYRMVRAVVDGEKVDTLAAAKAIRPLIEGYLNRRFPGLLDQTQVLGKSISDIRDSKPPSPLIHAQGIVTHLKDLNDNTTEYHHDEGGMTFQGSPNLQEVQSYAEDALAIIYGQVP
ncbi:AAA family ATPase [soil metagenome]